MHALAVALSAFSARAIRGRRAVLGAYSALVTLALVGVAQLVASRAAEEGMVVHPLALADMLAMFVVGGVLFVVAPAMVASQVAEERRSGTLDLLRTAPISPTALAAGFLVGAPGSLYLLCAGPLALHVAAGLLGAYPIAVLPMSLLILGLGAAATMLGAMLLASAVGREGGGAAPLMVAGLLATGTFVTAAMATGPDSMPWAFVHPAGAMAVLYQSFDGPFLDAFTSPWRLEQLAHGRPAAMMALEPVLAVIVYAVAGALLLGAARRVLAREVTSRLTKPAALALFAIAVATLMVPLAVVVPAAELRCDGLGVLTFCLAVPYVACVLGATPGRTHAGARALAPEGAPLVVGALMVGVYVAALFVFFGARPLEILREHRDEAIAAAGLVAVALSVPVYALFAATRLPSSAARLAFWALVTVHLSLLIPSIFIVAAGRHPAEITHLLAQLDLGLGVAWPLALAWRQRRALRGEVPAAAAV